METQNSLVVVKLWSQRKSDTQARKKQDSKNCMCLGTYTFLNPVSSLLVGVALFEIRISIPTWLWKTTQTFERKLNLTKSEAQPNQDISRMDCKKPQSRMNIYTGSSNDVLYWLCNRFLKKKLEFTSEFLVFLLFGKV